MDEEHGPVVQLYDHDGFGLIIDYPGGAVYTNQTGGTSILTPLAKGIYIPLRNSVAPKTYKFTSPEVELFDYFCGPKHKGTGATDGLDEEDADFIDAVLEKWELSDSLKVDRKRLEESHEAWVHVTVLGDEGNRRLNEPSSYEIRLQGNEVDPERAHSARLFDHYYLSIFYGFEPYPRAGILTWRNTD